MEYMIAIYDKTISPHASEIDAWGEKYMRRISASNIQPRFKLFLSVESKL